MLVFNEFLIFYFLAPIEVTVDLDESVRGKEVFILQTGSKLVIHWTLIT